MTIIDFDPCTVHNDWRIYQIFQSWERGFRLSTNATRVRKRPLRVPNILLLWALKQVTNSNQKLAEFSLIICVIIPTFFFPVTLRPNAGHGLLILEVF